MKRLFILFICFITLLCACQKNAEPEESYKLGGYKSENGYWYLDFDDPILEAKKKEIEVTLSDGTKDTAYMRRPMVNVDNEGANTVSESIKNYLDEKYGDYFKKPDDRIVKIDYETSHINDILTVIIKEEIITPKKTTEYVTCFHYDDLAGVELNIMEYSNTNGAQLSTVYKAVLESEWAAEYEKTTGNPPYEDIITGIVHQGNLMFDVYCLDTDGENVVRLELQVEDVPIQLPEIPY